ncbi:hypothetical protein [Candidatus Foliamicus sp.]
MAQTKVNFWQRINRKPATPEEVKQRLRMFLVAWILFVLYVGFASTASATVIAFSSAEACRNPDVGDAGVEFNTVEDARKAGYSWVRSAYDTTADCHYVEGAAINPSVRNPSTGIKRLWTWFNAAFLSGPVLAAGVWNGASTAFLAGFALVTTDAAGVGVTAASRKLAEYQASDPCAAMAAAAAPLPFDYWACRKQLGY